MQGVVETHKSTLPRFAEATSSGHVSVSVRFCMILIQRTLCRTMTNWLHDARLSLILPWRSLKRIMIRRWKTSMLYQPIFSTVRSPSTNRCVFSLYQHDRSLTTPLSAQLLVRLKAVRATFNSPAYDTLSDSPRQQSMYERELEHPRLNPQPITHPCPHIFDSAPMRPVSAAIQGGVGMLLGSPTRASVFGKFW